MKMGTRFALICATLLLVVSHADVLEINSSIICQCITIEGILTIKISYLNSIHLDSNPQVKFLVTRKK